MSQTDWHYPTSNSTTFFSDACALARGAACYLRAILQGIVTCLYPKSHVCTPSKNIIPHLELETALDAVKLSIIVKQELDLSRCPCLFWSNSTIVL